MLYTYYFGYGRILCTRGIVGWARSKPNRDRLGRDCLGKVVEMLICVATTGVSEFDWVIQWSIRRLDERPGEQHQVNHDAADFNFSTLPGDVEHLRDRWVNQPLLAKWRWSA